MKHIRANIDCFREIIGKYIALRDSREPPEARVNRNSWGGNTKSK